MTFEEKFASTNGRPAGFDYMRITLALGIVGFHSILTTYGQKFQTQIWSVPIYHAIFSSLLPAFFALSGFLVAGSLERCKTIAGFLFLRIIRIFPALVLEILLSAFILGPLLTSFSIPKYFHDPRFFHYLLNCIGDIHYELPGLFLNNPRPDTVNGQLWTVPYELVCYMILACLGILGISRNRWLLLAAVLAVFGAEALHFFTHTQINAVGHMSGGELVVCFLFGVLYYNFRSSIPYSRAIALVASAISIVLLLFAKTGLLVAPSIVYVIVYLGLSNPRRMAFLDYGDYSYGIFLYGFPIQQAVVATRLLPLIGLLDLAVALPFVILFAVCSWHLWEKRMLELRRFRPLIDRVFSITRPGLVTKHVYHVFIPAKP